MRYTKEILEEVVESSKSFAEVIRKLGLAKSGGTHRHLKSRIEKFGIDTTHFTGQSWSKGISPPNKKSSEDILIVQSINSSRQNCAKLRRALLETGVPHCCHECGLNQWNGKEIVLQIDHINGVRTDNRKENLRFLCPNCHSQTETWGNKKKSTLLR